MKTNFITIDDGCGIVGIAYKCPECKKVSMFVIHDDIEEDGCEHCGHKETFTDEQKIYIDNMW